MALLMGQQNFALSVYLSGQHQQHTVQSERERGDECRSGGRSTRSRNFIAHSTFDPIYNNVMCMGHEKQEEESLGEQEQEE